VRQLGEIFVRRMSICSVRCLLKNIGAFKHTSAAETRTPLSAPDVEKMSRTNPQTLHGDRTVKLSLRRMYLKSLRFLWSHLA
jgi:hypothetical protein